MSLANDSECANYYLEPQFQDDSGNLTPYDEISEAIAGSGKAAVIDSKIIKKAADMLRHEEFATHVFHIPLSAASFGDVSFVDRLSKVIEHFKLKPWNFSFVITSKDVRQNLAQAKDFCTRSRQLGCGCYISRFAEGEDDIALVREIPVTGIWFSNKLSEGFSSNENKLQRLKDLGNVMKSNDMKTILGNIHSPSDLANAWGIGVDFITGPFLHKGSVKPDFDFSRYARCCRPGESIRETSFRQGGLSVRHALGYMACRHMPARGFTMRGLIVKENICAEGLQKSTLVHASQE